ncbi:methionyl-tRNA formyltransferase [Campylobacter concisus]|uniref:methionyl-tRNA formyltransferase n=1 Tax=Campylobacter concisus TaxID=199 RepID=UPI000D3170B9|nr:formyltransferase family protein [Campylobacter concisus]
MLDNSEKKIVLVGCTEYGYDLYKPLIDNNLVSIGCIVTLNKEQSERYNVSGYKDLSCLVGDSSIMVYNPKSYDLKSVEDQNFFSSQKFDLMLMGGWQRLIPDCILRLLKFGGLGLHGSSELLPQGRGRSPVNWSIIQNKKRFLIHLFYLNAGVDDGDIIDIMDFDINEYDDCKTIYYKISILSRKMILNNLGAILNGNVVSKKQSGFSSYYPKRTPDDGIIDWQNMSVYEVYNKIRALTKPYPGAFTFCNGAKIIIWKAQIFDTRIIYYGSSFGEIVEVFSGGDFVVNCRDGLLLIREYTSFELMVGSVFSTIKGE